MHGIEIADDVGPADARLDERRRYTVLRPGGHTGAVLRQIIDYIPVDYPSDRDPGDGGVHRVLADVAPVVAVEQDAIEIGRLRPDDDPPYPDARCDLRCRFALPVAHHRHIYRDRQGAAPQRPMGDVREDRAVQPPGEAHRAGTRLLEKTDDLRDPVI